MKAFPDAIQVNEPGTVFNPLYRDRQSESSPNLPSPSDIADGITVAPMPPNTPQANQQYAPAHGQGGNMAHSSQAVDASKLGALPSPGDIADGTGPQVEKSWEQKEIDRRQTNNQDGNADNNQNGQGQSVPLPGEQQDQGRGRGGR